MGEVFKLNHCYNVDCVPAMELFPNNYFDLAVVDPPYFSGPERRGFYGSKVSKIGVHRDYPISPAWIRPGPYLLGAERTRQGGPHGREERYHLSDAALLIWYSQCRRCPSVRC